MDVDVEVEEFLEHYGVRGMKWGTRRNRDRPGGADGKSNSAGPSRAETRARLKTLKSESKDRLREDARKRAQRNIRDNNERVKKLAKADQILKDKGQGGLVTRIGKTVNEKSRIEDAEIERARDRINKSAEARIKAEKQYKLDKVNVGRREARIALREAKKISYREFTNNMDKAARETQQERIDAQLERIGAMAFSAGSRAFTR